MEHDALETLRKRHPAWILLASRNSAMVLSILNRAFVEPNASNIAADDLVRFVDDELYALREQLGDDAYPRSPGAYLDEWADADHGWLRKFYPPGDDQPHYDLTPAVQAALDFVGDLETRSFVGTESRLQTIFELLRQLADDRDADPSHRLAELRRRRDEIDAKIARAEAGYVDVLDSAARRDRYQQFARTARELLADFRQVEENFRLLDRQLRERIAGWDGSKGELLDEMIADRHSIAEARLVVANLDAMSLDLEAGAIAVFARGRLRIRRLPLRGQRDSVHQRWPNHPTVHPTDWARRADTDHSHPDSAVDELRHSVLHRRYAWHPSEARPDHHHRRTLPHACKNLCGYRATRAASQCHCGVTDSRTSIRARGSVRHRRAPTESALEPKISTRRSEFCDRSLRNVVTAMGCEGQTPC